MISAFVTQARLVPADQAIPDKANEITAIPGLLARLGLTTQTPLQRAYQRDTYPAIARRAKAGKADIYFWDESGFRADAVQGKTWGVKGETPVVHMRKRGLETLTAMLTGHMLAATFRFFGRRGELQGF